MPVLRPMSLMFAILVAGCVQPQELRAPSTVPVSGAKVALARAALAQCRRHAPDWEEVSAALRASGFVDTWRTQVQTSYVVGEGDSFAKPGTGVAVQVLSRGKEGACIVGVEGMTPAQARDLARPIAAAYGARTNAQRGQGLARDVIEAWGSLTQERIVYIAAYKAWDYLKVPSGAVRLLYRTR